MESNNSLNKNINKSKDEIISLTSRFHDALKSKPVDEKTIVSILNSTSNSERQLIRSQYKSLFSVPIQSDISSNLTFKFKDLCINLFDTLFEYDAKEIHKSIHSFMNDDKTLVEIFASRPQTYFSIIDQAYQNFFKISLKDDLNNEIGKNEEYLAFLYAIMDTSRPEKQTISVNDAYDYAKKINENGIKKWGSDVELFKEMFLLKSREDLILIARAYNELFNKNLYEEINGNVGGKNRRLMKGLLLAVITPAEYFAKKLFKAIQGNGGDTEVMNRILISRSEVDMGALRDYYFMARKKDIYTDIQKDTNKAYGEVLSNLSLK